MGLHVTIAKVYIDGFNLYFGSLKKTSFKWLDLSSSCQHQPSNSMPVWQQRSVGTFEIKLKLICNEKAVCGQSSPKHRQPWNRQPDGGPHRLCNVPALEREPRVDYVLRSGCRFWRLASGLGGSPPNVEASSGCRGRPLPSQQSQHPPFECCGWVYCDLCSCSTYNCDYCHCYTSLCRVNLLRRVPALVSTPASNPPTYPALSKFNASSSSSISGSARSLGQL